MRRKKRKSGKIIFGILIIAALAVSAFVVYEYFLKPKTEEAPAEVTTPTVLNPEPDNPTDDGKGSEETPETVNGKEPVVQYDGQNPNNSGELTGVVTYAGATENNIIVRVNIDQYTDGGNCVLNLRQNGSTVYSMGAALIADVSTSTCDGFNISRSSIYNASGTYEIVIDLYSNDKAGTINGELSL